MKIGKSTALIDNDFLGHIVETKRPIIEIAEIIQRALKSLDLFVAMHPLVYKNELLDEQNRKYLFKQKVIYQIEFSDMFEADSAEELYYCWLVPELYRKIFGDNIKATGKNILTYWVRGQSLGEIHSMAACLVCHCGMFLSDDSDSKYLKTIIEKDYSREITVYNRKEFMEALPQNTLKRKEARTIAHDI